MQETLSHYFGYKSFRPGQEKIITKILNHHIHWVYYLPVAVNRYAIRGTGFNAGGTTIVISPLISLMKDQVDQLQAMGIQAAYLNSGLTHKQQKRLKRSVGAIRSFIY